MAGIAHKDLTDPQLHEPKGASEATIGETIFADGNGGTTWGPIEIDKLSFEKEVVEIVTDSSVTDCPEASVAGLSATTDGVLSDAINFTMTNKNVKELALKHNELVQKFNTLLAEHKSLISSVNDLIVSLQTTGFIQ